MKVFTNGRFVGERALFSSHGLRIESSVFEDGESPLKESSDISLRDCEFGWKYPLWYCKDVTVERTTLKETARSGIWYTHNIVMRDCDVIAPKTFRRSSGIRLYNVSMPNACESMWNCSDITLDTVSITGDYFGMNSLNIEAKNLDVYGNYIFDGGRNIVVRSSRLISKDAFWNCENVTVYDSAIVGEYLGWNSKNVTFINCTIESNQGLCYMDGVTMKNCKLINTDLAFEYSRVDADIVSSIDSIKNPLGGRIIADSIGEIIIERDRADSSLTEIIVRK